MPRGDRVSRRVFRAHGVGYDVQIYFGAASVTPQLRARADAVLAHAESLQLGLDLVASA